MKEARYTHLPKATEKHTVCVLLVLLIGTPLLCLYRVFSDLYSLTLIEHYVLRICSMRVTYSICKYMALSWGEQKHSHIKFGLSVGFYRGCRNSRSIMILDTSAYLKTTIKWTTNRRSDSSDGIGIGWWSAWFNLTSSLRRNFQKTVCCANQLSLQKWFAVLFCRSPFWVGPTLVYHSRSNRWYEMATTNCLCPKEAD